MSSAVGFRGVRGEIVAFAAVGRSSDNAGSRFSDMKIRSLKPNVSQEEAVAQFQAAGPMRWIRSSAMGPLRSVAAAYLPFQLFRVTITNRGLTQQKLLGVDAVTGTLDLFEFEHVPGDGEMIWVETRNCPGTRLDGQRLGDLLQAKVRRMLYSRGFFRMRDLTIVPEVVSTELHVPYWLGFRGSSREARISVIDAVRRRPEGAKVRTLFESWLTSAGEERSGG